MVLTPTSKGQAALDTAIPHYYYDRETTFILNYAADDEYGGIYTTVDEDGDLLNDFLPDTVWGFAGGTIRGIDKSALAQATCIRYFITEYQRVTFSGYGVEGINTLLNNRTITAEDLLGQAQSCADFVIDHLEIPAEDQTAMAIPNRLYYYAFSNRQGIGGFVDETGPAGTGSASRSESSIAWSIAELALALKNADLPYQRYQDAALRWWDWRQTEADELPPYSGAGLPSCDGAEPPDPDPNNCIPAIGRDVFYPALGFTLSELTEDGAYRDAVITYTNGILGEGDTPDLTFPPPNTLQDGAYIAGYGRAVIFAKHDQQELGSLEGRDQWWDFGNYPLILGLIPEDNPEFPPNLGIPFTHFRGRELVAGTHRALWFYHTFGVNPNIFYADVLSDAEAVRLATDAYWDYINEIFWDDTPGQAAWFEAEGLPYKPCFAGGTDIPIGDWLPPEIGDKTHTVNPNNSALVTITGVSDQPFPYLNWYFDGSGVTLVEVVYSVDEGQTWDVIPAAASADGSYDALIPPQPLGTIVYYYARVHDLFGNITAFPEGTETWDSAGLSLGQSIEQAQQYAIG